MRRHQPLIAENSYSSDGVHALRMQKSREFWQVADDWLGATRESVIERNIDHSVAVLHVKNHGIAAQFAPAADDAQAAIAVRHHTSQIHCPNFKIGCNRNRFLND